MATADEQLKNWYFYLQAMHDAAQKINASTPDDLSAFAKTKISPLLPNQAQQDQFIQLADSRTGLKMSTGDLSASTFCILVTNLYIPQATCILRVFKLAANDSVTTESQFGQQLLKNTYKTDADRTAAINHLQSDTPAACLTTAQLQALKTELTSSTATVQQAVQSIAIS